MGDEFKDAALIGVPTIVVCGCGIDPRRGAIADVVSPSARVLCPRSWVDIAPSVRFDDVT